MWLINTETLELKFFIDEYEVRYAILSHTWGDDEVSFQDFSDLDKARRKAGFGKIEKTCELALVYGLSWAWVDTCCIDKTSSAELSEAINSMFKFYQRSHICFVYLVDVSHVIDPRSQGSASEERCDQFETWLRNCRWVTRGWTLQELIAPSCLEFFDSMWASIGSKTDHIAQIATVTGIDQAILRNEQELGEVSIARRMSWASRRETTRREDMAYCLFGIFDVNMPLLYGEGDKSFIRLQEEIVKETSDLSLFAWKHTNRNLSFSGVLATSPAYFRQSGNLRPCVPSNRRCYDFMNSSMGLRIMGYGFPYSPEPRPSTDEEHPDFIWNLELKEYHKDGRYPDSIHTPLTIFRIGVYLVKTTNGYVRTRPAELYRAVDEGPFRQGKNLLLRKYVTYGGSYIKYNQIATRFHKSVKVKLPKNTRILRTTPSALWVDSLQLFLNPGSGVNAFIHFDIMPSVTYPVIPNDSCPFIVGLTTTNTLACSIWQPEDTYWQFLNAWMEAEEKHGPHSDWALSVQCNHWLRYQSRTQEIFAKTSRRVVRVRVEISSTENDQSRYLLTIE
ncbi:heterokaryon incompatibility protein-domain-containing protein [Xylariaceae sp. FL1019]|nr:heterokaryon incompatibility protein-domain-containing protein [Xylariaceae sp. FL1019]